MYVCIMYTCNNNLKLMHIDNYFKLMQLNKHKNIAYLNI